jgi:uncharacterized protein (TIGR03437 family)
MSRTLRVATMAVSALLLLVVLPVPAWAQSPEVLAVVSNATFRAGPLTPGYIAAVFGTNLNDGSPLVLSSLGADGNLLTSLGGTSVRINNIPAPVFYSTPQQLGIQIPFDLLGQSTATIQVTVGNQTSAPRTILLEAFVPTLFESSRDISGPPEAAAILHEDGTSPVTFEAPAKRGEVIVIYALGLGSVTPPLPTGTPSMGNRTVATPTVTIDGIAAEVQFSGAAPGFVGLYQINAKILAVGPRTLETLVVSIGGKQSDPLTIAVLP